VTRHTDSSIALDEPLTLKKLTQLWQSYDEPLTLDELNQLLHPRTPRIVIVGWCVFVPLLVTIAVSTVWLLRVVGGA
jgi:hypothetical protein